MAGKQRIFAQYYVTSSTLSLRLSYFARSSRKGEKIHLARKVYFDFHYILYPKAFLISWKFREMLPQKYLRLHVWCLCPILIKPEFSRRTSIKVSNIKFHDVRPVRVELFYPDGCTYVTMLIARFAQLRERA